MRKLKLRSVYTDTVMMRFALYLVIATLVHAPSAPAACGLRDVLGGLWVKRKVEPDVLTAFPESATKRTRIAALPGSPASIMTEVEFLKSYPFDANSRLAQQTELVFEGGRFRVSGFKPEKGLVTLERDRILEVSKKQLAGQKKEVGALVKKSGRIWVVENMAGNKSIFLKRRELVEMPLSEFEQIFKRNGLAAIAPDYVTTGIERIKGKIEIASQGKSTVSYHHTFREPMTDQKMLEFANQKRQNGSILRVRDEIGHSRDLTSTDIGWIEVEELEDVMVIDKKSGSLETRFTRGKDMRWREVVYRSSESIQLKLKSNKLGHELLVHLPDSGNAQANQKKIQKLVEILEDTPLAAWNSTHTLRINPGPYDLEIVREIEATANREPHLSFVDHGAIDFFDSRGYPDLKSHPESLRPSIYLHEVGHQFSVNHLQSWKADAHWLEVMMLDKKWVSEYAMTNVAEDFAETFELYLRTDAGRLDANARANFPHRFKKLDDLFYRIEHSSPSKP